MKKRHIVCVAGVLAAALCASAIIMPTALTRCSNVDFASMKERVEAEYEFNAFGMASVKQYTYEELKAAAEIIVIAESVDALTSKNSLVSASVGPTQFVSERTIETLKQLKGGEIGSAIVKQNCGLNEKKQIFSFDESCIPLMKGDIYALYAKEKEDGKLSALSTDNGILNLTYLKLNARADLATMAAIDLLGADFPEELQDAYFKSKHPANRMPEEILTPIFVDNKHEWKTIVITTPYTIEGMEATVEYVNVDGVDYFRTEGYPTYYDGSW